MNGIHRPLQRLSSNIKYLILSFFVRFLKQGNVLGCDLLDKDAKSTSITLINSFFFSLIKKFYYSMAQNHQTSFFRSPFPFMAYGQNRSLILHN